MKPDNNPFRKDRSRTAAERRKYTQDGKRSTGKGPGWLLLGVVVIGFVVVLVRLAKVENEAERAKDKADRAQNRALKVERDRNDRELLENQERLGRHYEAMRNGSRN